MKKNKGITLIALTVAIAIMIIISSMLVYSAKNGVKMRNLNLMYNDVEILTDKISSHYAKYGDIPIEIRYLGPINFIPNANDSQEYYVIDLTALESITLNYGLDFNNIHSEEDTKTHDDVYIIDKQSHHVYYAHGIILDEITYYTNETDAEINLYI